VIDRSKLLKKFNYFKNGFSLVEILVVVAILSLLILGGIRGYLLHLAKARDATRKSDLNEIKVAFTDYLGDNGCFPTYEILTNCGGNDLVPYLDKIPCDPKTMQPYYLDVDTEVACPRHYRVLATLEINNDPVIAVLHCDGEAGCGGNGLETYNYGVADGVPVGNIEYLGRDGGGVVPTATPQPTNTPAPGLPTATPGPTSTPTPVPPTPTPPSEPYTHCCPKFGDHCQNYDPGAGSCDGGLLYTSLTACQEADNGCDY